MYSTPEKTSLFWKKGKNTKHGAENTGVEYLNFLVYKAPGVEYPKKSRNFGLSVSDFQDKSHKILGILGPKKSHSTVTSKFSLFNQSENYFFFSFLFNLYLGIK